MTGTNNLFIIGIFVLIVALLCVVIVFVIKTIIKKMRNKDNSNEGAKAQVHQKNNL